MPPLGSSFGERSWHQPKHRKACPQVHCIFLYHGFLWGWGASLHSDQAIPERPSNPAQVERRKRLGEGGRTNGTLIEEALPAIFDLAAPLAWFDPTDRLTDGSKMMHGVPSYHVSCCYRIGKVRHGGAYL